MREWIINKSKMIGDFFIWFQLTDYFILLSQGNMTIITVQIFFKHILVFFILQINFSSFLIKYYQFAIFAFYCTFCWRNVFFIFFQILSWGYFTILFLIRGIFLIFDSQVFSFIYVQRHFFFHRIVGRCWNYSWGLQ